MAKCTICGGELEKKDGLFYCPRCVKYYRVERIEEGKKPKEEPVSPEKKGSEFEQFLPTKNSSFIVYFILLFGFLYWFLNMYLSVSFMTLLTFLPAWIPASVAMIGIIILASFVGSALLMQFTLVTGLAYLIMFGVLAVAVPFLAKFLPNISALFAQNTEFGNFISWISCLFKNMGNMEVCGSLIGPGNGQPPVDITSTMKVNFGYYDPDEKKYEIPRPKVGEKYKFKITMENLFPEKPIKDVSISGYLYDGKDETNKIEMKPENCYVYQDCSEKRPCELGKVPIETYICTAGMYSCSFKDLNKLVVEITYNYNTYREARFVFASSRENLGKVPKIETPRIKGPVRLIIDFEPSSIIPESKENEVVMRIRFANDGRGNVIDEKSMKIVRLDQEKELLGLGDCKVESGSMLESGSMQSASIFRGFYSSEINIGESSVTGSPKIVVKRGEKKHVYSCSFPVLKKDIDSDFRTIPFKIDVDYVYQERFVYNIPSLDPSQCGNGKTGTTVASGIVKQKIIDAAEASGIPTWVALGIAQVESNMNHFGVGQCGDSERGVKIGCSGEVGLFQIMPGTEGCSREYLLNLDNNIECAMKVIWSKCKAFYHTRGIDCSKSKESVYYDCNSKYYSGWDIAIRGYNGWSCLNLNYVENVRAAGLALARG